MSGAEKAKAAGQGAQTATDDAPPHRYTAVYANRIEAQWQQRWEAARVHRQPNPGEAGFDASKPKYYVLDMFPYPSGAGLHIGHPEGYTATDIVARFRRMNGYNVLHPMGWDAFGLPAEQYAIQTGVHPAITTKAAIDNFRRQLTRFGFSYDWSREFGTIDASYYKWTQWIFLELYGAWFEDSGEGGAGGGGKARPIAELERQFAAGVRAVRFNPRAEEVPDADRARAFGPWGTLDGATRRRILDSYRLAYLGETTVNWCPKLGTVLANDEVIDGKSERGGHPVLRKPLKQWMFRITAYAERLLAQLEGLDWPASTKAIQREWIGKSEGAEVEFAVGGLSRPTSLRIFTTRPDTIFGATFMVVAPEHPLCELVIAGGASGVSVDEATRAALAAYVARAKNRSDVERQETKDKTGAFTGLFATNPATGKPIPIWTADYVLMGYGTGAIMAVPGQDQRDWDFAKAYDLPIVRTVQPTPGFEGEAYVGEGPAINSGFLDGLQIVEAKAKIIAWLEAQGIGARRVTYKLRDWTFSRQRYWGEPFPIVYDASGNAYPVSSRALPVELPALADYAPVESDDPLPLLAKAKDWMHTTAGAAGVDPALLDPATPVTREANTMPGSAGSSWYAIRYCDASNPSRIVGEAAERYWMGDGVDLYLGGSEHAVGHLLYSRFWQNVLFDLGHVSTKEPFRKLFHQGMITSFAYQRADKSIVPVDEVREVSEGQYVEIATGKAVTPIVTKMSKRYKNVVNPDDVLTEFGADTCRLYEMYMGPLEASKPWNPRDIVGCFRFLQRAWRLCVDEQTGAPRIAPAPDEKIEKLLHRTIAKVTQDIDRMGFNTAIAAMIEFVNAAFAHGLTQEQGRRFALALSPFAPHLAEELWSKLGGQGFASTQAWPRVDSAMLADDDMELPVSVNGKVRGRVRVPVATAKDAKALEQFVRADAGVASLLAGKALKKLIVVPGKMINAVVEG